MEKKDQNEVFLEKTAITFSLNAISSDLKEFIEKRIEYNLKILNEIHKLIQTITESKQKTAINDMLSEGSTIQLFLESAAEDYRANNKVLELLTEDLRNQKECLIEELEEPDSTRQQ